MRSIILYTLILFTSVGMYAQTYSHEWIQYDQKYYIIPIVKEGIYRISLSNLTSNNVPTGEFQPKNLQLFHNGEEQPIYVKGENDGVFHATDYIEFYANRNTGILDTSMYEKGVPVNPDYSLVNDTAYYYLTWNTATNNKRITSETAINFSSYTPETSCIVNSRINFSSWYNKSIMSFYITEGEGFMESYFREGTTKTHTLITDNYIDVSYPSRFEICFAGSSTHSHNLHITIPGNTKSTTYSGYTKLIEQISTTYALDSLSPVTVRIEDDLNPATSDNNCFVYIDAEYSRDLDLESLSSLHFKSNSSSGADKLYYNFGSITNGVLYDITNGRRVELTQNGIGGRCLIPKTNEVQQFFLTKTSVIQAPQYIKAVKSKNTAGGYFFDFSKTFNQGDYIIISHPQLWASAEKYKAYRESTGYNVVLIDINELYRQFAYGVLKHPIGVRNFLKYAMSEWEDSPEHMFIIGKGIQLKDLRDNSGNFENCLIPTMGFPASDVLYSASLFKENFMPEVATGRLAAKSEYEVDLYLSKIKEYELNQSAEWMKRVLHFGGGSNYYEQSTFKSYLKNYERIIEGTYFAGNVSTFLKASSDPIEITKSDQILQLVNDGCSMMTFFGHASGEGFDQNIDHPSVYNNSGKYPLILANSCYAGDIFDPNNASISETWVLIKDKGAVGFLGGVALGYDVYLNRYSKELITSIANSNYGGSIGKSMQAAVNKNYLLYGNDLNTKFACMNFTLHGDPALVLNYHEKPDLLAQASAISFDPKFITTDLDSMTINIVLKNIGKYVVDTFLISISHTLPDGNSEIIIDTINQCAFSDTLEYRFPINSYYAGLNSISIDFDIADNVDELNEINNALSVEFLISSNDLLPVYPFEFAIVPDNKITLKACPVDPLASINQCEIEIDTSYLFNSPLKQNAVVSVISNIAEWQPQLTLKEDQVYYWRVSKVDETGDERIWNESSFTYKEGKNGWSQADMPQFVNDNYNLIDYDLQTREFDFIQTPKQLYVSTKGSANSSNYDLVKTTLDGTMVEWGSCQATPAINLVVLNPVTFEYWLSNHGDFGHRNYPTCGSRAQRFLVYTSSDSTQIDEMCKFLKDTVPDGFYIVAYTFVSGNFNTWYDHMFQTFEDLGAKNIRNVPHTNPYIFFTQKGNVASTREVIGIESTSFIEMYQELDANYFEGSIVSKTIGPSSAFNTLIWESVEKETTDQVSLSIYGISPSGQDILLASDIKNKTINQLDTIVDASIYPIIKLVFNTSDEINRTPSQLIKWQVYLDPAPETTLTLNDTYRFHADSLNKGEELQLIVSTRNIGKIDMDTLLVRYSIINSSNSLVHTEDHRLHHKHSVDSLATDTLLYNTASLQGNYILKTEYNPMNLSTNNYDQIEQYHFNNILIKNFKVYGDDKNPLLDVSFDGVHILDGDIVSAKPEIVISLKDENKYFSLNDTSLYTIYLEFNEALSDGRIESKSERIYFNSVSDKYSLTLDTTDVLHNKSKVLFKPILADGTYTLKVAATDVAGNASGDYDYIISFQVINEASISNVINYPNPFTTATRFVFTLTGSEIPTDFRIQIFTISGILIKEIELDQFNDIHVGRNITDYSWDGRDKYGDRLANGVYLYKVIAKNGSEVLKNYSEPKLDKYFVNGFGKMYLMK